MFTVDLYAKVFRNRVVVRNVSTSATIDRTASPPFSHPRSLIRNFTHAQALFKAAVAEVTSRGLPKLIRIVLHPMELLEGGLTQVEETALRELALGARASKVVVWVGPELGDDAVRKKLS